tara:strand:- start:229 stop:1689 length:1461 start_codon:yes stop_codon:yes gene_type:complete
VSQRIRVRYAPSPTGQPHIGNIRTALFNWLFARNNGGDFIVRVEDTDQERLVPGAVDSILDGLDWLNIDWDEGPRIGGPYGSYFQSERLELYAEAANRLISQGDAYRCYCTKERLDEVRKERQQQKLDTSYDRHCLELGQSELETLEQSDLSFVVRFAMPTEGITQVEDLIRGNVEWQNRLLDDFIILKSDGFPTYHLAVVVDDHFMDISHVLRAEEWLSSTPRHINLYRTLGFDPPEFGHLPMILGTDRSKLSKRHGATSILEYREEGFLNDAVKNFMVLLGWSFDDHTEVMSNEFLVNNFDLKRVGKPAAIFDIEKLQWMNGLYIRDLTSDQLADRMMPFLERDLRDDIKPVDGEYLLRIVPLIQERLKTLNDSADMVSYFLEECPRYDLDMLYGKGGESDITSQFLDLCLEEITKLKNFTSSELERILRDACDNKGFSIRQSFGSLRTAMTGRTATPPLFAIMEVMGRQRVIDRLEAAVRKVA